MGAFDRTQFFKKPEKEPENEVSQIMTTVYNALTEKGYNPMYQLVGYILSGDPTYITSHKQARTLITKLERDELLEEIIKDYIKNNVTK